MYFISGYPKEDQMITESTLFLTRDKAKAFLQSANANKSLKTKINKLNHKQITSFTTVGDNSFLEVFADVKGDLWNDFKPKSVSLKLRGEEITPQIIEWSIREANRIESERQKKWRRSQAKLNKK